MTKPSLLLLLVIALSSGPAAAVTGAAGTAADGTRGTAVFIGEDHEGNVVVLRRDAGADHAASCGGFAAPVVVEVEGVTRCSTGFHPRTPLFHGFDFDRATYAGDLQSVLSGSGGQRRFTCSVVVVQGEILDLSCTGSGPWPWGRFVHDGYSRLYGTIDRDDAGSGIPGGVGTWTNFVQD